LSSHYNVIVVGGGAAGLMCAIEAGKRGRRVLIIESNERVGRKIEISGGGRCNFTNVYAGPENFISANPDFARSALARYTPAAFIALVEKHGIAYHEKKLGQLFCDGSSRQIVDLLLAECADAGVEIRTVCGVSEVRHDGDFSLETTHGPLLADALVVATGGLSIAKIGATDFGYQVARQFAIDIVQPRPGLVPLTFAGGENAIFANLAGVSVDVTAGANGQSFRENLLFTHHGLSGPAILQISSYVAPGDTLSINLQPNVAALEFLTALRQDARELVTVLSEHLPRRFAEAWCNKWAPSRRMRDYSDRQIEGIAQRLEAWQLFPKGTQGYGKAEVTVGGVDTRELSSRTMESRKVPGLYFIGEVVDVTGWLGGFNFQWAWASGFAAGQAV
jgi:predicted Rossmann fold flavoprotein